MLNKKGTTLAEVIISIVLISVVLVFMVRLLLDLNNIETNSTFASDNQINRSEIIRMIGNDLNENILTGITDSSTSDVLNITFSFKDNTKSLLVATNDKLSYTSSDSITRTWTMEDCEIYVPRANVYYSPDYKSEENRIYTLTIDIEIHTINEKNDVNNNNTLDDIIISYLGNVSDYNTPISCLGNEC